MMDPHQEYLQWCLRLDKAEAKEEQLRCEIICQRAVIVCGERELAKAKVALAKQQAEIRVVWKERLDALDAGGA